MRINRIHRRCGGTADAPGSGPGGRKAVGVQIPPPARLEKFTNILLVVAFILLPRAALAADTRVILFIIDSVSAELMYEMLDSGELPNLSSALAANGIRVEEATAPFPTISFYAHACILTGCWADRHGVTAIRWYDHRTGNSRSYAGIGSELIDRDMNPGIKTIFEHLEDLHTASIGSVVHRGADEYVHPWLPPDGARLHSLMKRYRRSDPPRLSVVVLTGIDWPAHRYGPKSAWVRIDLRKLDRKIGRLMALLKKRGLDRSTYIFLTADHGHSHREGYVNLYDHLTKQGFDILDKFLYTGRTEGFTRYDAALWMAGVGYAFLYLPHRTDTDLDWTRRPDENMLRAYPVGGRRIDLIKDLTAIPQIAFIVVRDTQSGTFPAFSSSGRLNIAKDLSAYPDVQIQLVHLMAAERAPDILVVAKDGYETAWSWHHGRHGGYSREEMIVPLLAIGPGILPGQIPRARSIDLTPTILSLFGRYTRPADFDGVPIPLFSQR